MNILSTKYEEKGNLLLTFLFFIYLKVIQEGKNLRIVETEFLQSFWRRDRPVIEQLIEVYDLNTKYGNNISE